MNEIQNPIGDLPGVTRLLGKLIDAGLVLNQPRHTRKLADAEAKANLIRARSEIDVADLRQRAKNRRDLEELLHQENIESVIAGAIPEVSADARPEDMDEDWISKFFEKCRITSDSQMQLLWSRILAGEANSPDSYSKRTVNFVSELSKEEAELFSSLCGFYVDFGSVKDVLVFDVEDHIYASHRISFDAVNRLSEIGLIEYSHVTGFVIKRLKPNRRYRALYFGKGIYVEIGATQREFDVGQIRLTMIGKELQRICGAKPVDGFLEYVVEKWSKYSAKIL